MGRIWLQQPPNITFGFAKQMKCLCLCGLSSNICLEISENKEWSRGWGGERARELTSGVQGQGKKEEKTFGGKTSLHNVHIL